MKLKQQQLSDRIKPTPFRPGPGVDPLDQMFLPEVFRNDRAEELLAEELLAEELLGEVEKRLELVKQVSHSTHKKLTGCLQGQQGVDVDKRILVKPDDIMQVQQNLLQLRLQKRPVHRGLDPDPEETSPPWTRPRSRRDQSTVD
ncbi:Rho GTPase-activating protein 44 [Liparis tanakae]|uniref:Rho GTPase-activating protein 44 n=1 Tax=Liparis tanakae TaxID=230148 RepID=A0A4Z2GFU3_9TELE|nr:Rho GTPase-activating protein 44 [Liparis tanakae]